MNTHLTTENLAKFSLRLGLAFVFLYAGISILLDPVTWSQWVPDWIADLGLPVTLFLQLHAVGEIILALAFLSGFFVKYAGILAALDLLSIVIFSGTAGLYVTFRDVGLTAMSLALAFLSWKK